MQESVWMSLDEVRHDQLGPQKADATVWKLAGEPMHG